MAPPTVTPSLEDYLETIHFLQQRNGSVRVTDVANELNVTKPSVNKAMNNLKTQGLVEHERYGLLELTETGAELAIGVARRHRILKAFFIDVLGVDEDTAEKEACAVEHSLGSVTIDRLAAHMAEVKNKASE